MAKVQYEAHKSDGIWRYFLRMKINDKFARKLSAFYAHTTINVINKLLVGLESNSKKSSNFLVSFYELF